MNNVNFLVEQANRFCDNIRRNNVFFTALEAGKLNDLMWVWQLLSHSDNFCRALSVRSGMCEDEAFKDVFADHAHAEIKHPKQLKTWMAKEGFNMKLIGSRHVAPTPETESCSKFCHKVAMLSDSRTQVFVMNVVSERMALLFYQAAGAVLQANGKKHGPYWVTHEDVDDIHAAMGLELVGELSDRDCQVLEYIIEQTAHHYDEMLRSWATWQLEL